MTEKQAHTPTALPWALEDAYTVVSAVATDDGKPRFIVNTDVEARDAECVANARLIVRAVNSHAALVNACEAMVHATKMNDSALGAVAAMLASDALAKLAGDA